MLVISGGEVLFLFTPSKVNLSKQVLSPRTNYVMSLGTGNYAIPLRVVTS